MKRVVIPLRFKFMNDSKFQGKLKIQCSQRLRIWKGNLPSVELYDHEGIWTSL